MPDDEAKTGEPPPHASMVSVLYVGSTVVRSSTVRPSSSSGTAHSPTPAVLRAPAPRAADRRLLHSSRERTAQKEADAGRHQPLRA